MRSVPVPSSRVNCNSFLDFFTASHAFTFTARKSDLLNVSKSTSSLNSGSISTLEKSIFSFAVKNPLLSPAVTASASFPAFAAFLSESRLFIVGNFFDC